MVNLKKVCWSSLQIQLTGKSSNSASILLQNQIFSKAGNDYQNTMLKPGQSKNFVFFIWFSSTYLQHI